MQKSKHNDLAEKIYQRIKGTPGMDDHELRQHAMLLAMTPEQRCEYSVRVQRANGSPGTFIEALAKA